MSVAIDDKKRHGIHYTPAALASFLADRGVAALEVRNTHIRVLDPACGDGELLIAAISALDKAGFSNYSLHGLDLDPGAVAVARERLAKSPCSTEIKQGDFVDQIFSSDESKFDLVITNPPYVRTQALGSKNAQFLAQRFSLKGRVDLTHAFVAVAGEALPPGGSLAILCSNRFMTTKAGANVRATLRNSYKVREVYDLGDTKIFDAAVLPAVVIATKNNTFDSCASSDNVPFISAYRAEKTQGSVSAKGLFDALIHPDSPTTLVNHDETVVAVESGTLRVDSPLDSTWTLESDESRSWLDQVARNTWKTFGDLVKIRVGIKTTADSVFIRDDWESLPYESQPEESLLLPLLTHRNTTAWNAPSRPETRVLYPYDLDQTKRCTLELDNYPRSKTYLENHYERLAGRKYVIEGGREWFEIWVPQKPSAWTQPKIVFPDISVEPRFSIDRSGAIVNGDCYWVSFDQFDNEDLAYLLVGVANSSTALMYYDVLCGNKLYAGRRRWMTQYVNRLPLPDPSTSAAKRIIDVARQLCNGGLDATAQKELAAELNVLVDAAFSAPECSDQESGSEQPDGKSGDCLTLF